MLFRESMVVKLNLRQSLKCLPRGKGQFCLVLIALTAVTADHRLSWPRALHCTRPHYRENPGCSITVLRPCPRSQCCLAVCCNLTISAGIVAKQMQVQQRAVGEQTPHFNQLDVDQILRMPQHMDFSR